MPTKNLFNAAIMPGFGMLSALTSLVCVTAFAQPYPNKPIELIVTTSAGSGGDVVSRTVAEIVRRWHTL